MSECKQTNPCATEDHHTHVLSDPHNTICSTGDAKKHQLRSDLITQCKTHLPQPWQGLASLGWTLPKYFREDCLSHSREAAELELLQRG